MGSILDLLNRLREAGVEFVVVGGLAATAHGSSVVTEDADICAPLTQDNVRLIIQALAGLNPRFRMSPKRPPMPNDPEQLRGFKNLNLVTDFGQVDVLTEVAGIGGVSEVATSSMQILVSGKPLRVLTLDALIESKRAMGRPKDRQVLIELEAIRARQEGLR